MAQTWKGSAMLGQLGRGLDVAVEAYKYRGAPISTVVPFQNLFHLTESMDIKELTPRT